MLRYAKINEKETKISIGVDTCYVSYLITARVTVVNIFIFSLSMRLSVQIAIGVYKSSLEKEMPICR